MDRADKFLGLAGAIFREHDDLAADEVIPSLVRHNAVIRGFP